MKIFPWLTFSPKAKRERIKQQEINALQQKIPMQAIFTREQIEHLWKINEQIKPANVAVKNTGERFFAEL